MSDVSATVEVRELLVARRRRLVAALKDHIERYCGKVLDSDDLEDLKADVVASVNVYHDVCLDILKAHTAGQPVDAVQADSAAR